MLTTGKLPLDAMPSQAYQGRAAPEPYGTLHLLSPPRSNTSPSVTLDPRLLAAPRPSAGTAGAESTATGPQRSGKTVKARRAAAKTPGRTAVLLRVPSGSFHEAGGVGGGLP
eukprot:3610123-Heterocapsa_arctica.AAC.1